MGNVIKIIKIWVDDVRTPPHGYTWCKSVRETIKFIEECEADENNRIVVIDLDHDSGNFFEDGGDFIRVLDYLEATKRNYPVHIHTMNPVGRSNMLRIVYKNGWRLV